MNWQSPTDKCDLTCVLLGTDKCVRNVLSCGWLAEHHLSLGALQGLKSVYLPGDLPPCINFQGDINWHHAAEEPAGVGQ